MVESWEEEEGVEREESMEEWRRDVCMKRNIRVRSIDSSHELKPDEVVLTG